MNTTALIAALLTLPAFPQADNPDTPTVRAKVGTVPVGGADGVAIWRNPDDPSKSTVIGANPKKGLAVFSLDGKVIQEINFPKRGGGGGVDVRDGFPLGGKKVSLVAGGVLRQRRIFAFTVDPATGKLQDALKQPLPTGVAPYGSCLYHSQKSKKFFLFITSKKGDIEQWELSEDKTSGIGATRVRTLRLREGKDLTVEACVADDALGHLYIAQENECMIWKYGAEPDGSSEPRKVDMAGIRKGDNVEGLAIVPTGAGKGFLVVSIQNSWRYKVYTREEPHKLIRTFRILTAAGNGEVQSHDCIEISTQSFGAAFPEGFLVTQNANNAAGYHFQLAPWNEIRDVIGGAK